MFLTNTKAKAEIATRDAKILELSEQVKTLTAEAADRDSEFEKLEASVSALTGERDKAVSSITSITKERDAAMVKESESLAKVTATEASVESMAATKAQQLVANIGHKPVTETPAGKPEVAAVELKGYDRVREAIKQEMQSLSPKRN